MHLAVFPGQGSQQVGMLADLYPKFPVVQRVFNQASQSLGYDLWALIESGPAETLNLTEHAQPALLAASVACYRVWQQHDIPLPSFLAGHSLGEYTALVIAEALTLTAGCQLVAQRGRLMQHAVGVGEGSMAAIIGLANQTVDDLCQQASKALSQHVSAANYNCDGQVVISGHTQAVQAVCDLAAPQARLCKLLPVSVPSHSPLMQNAADALAKTLESTHIMVPKIPVLHNVDGARHSHPDDIRQCLVAQISQPVQWLETIKAVIREGVSCTVEFGPGRVLVGINKRIDRQVRHCAVYDQASLQKSIDTIANIKES
jgi:[acyl-carrier-protein] S-malonyltransferase